MVSFEVRRVFFKSACEVHLLNALDSGKQSVPMQGGDLRELCIDSGLRQKENCRAIKTVRFKGLYRREQVINCDTEIRITNITNKFGLREMKNKLANKCCF